MSSPVLARSLRCLLVTLALGAAAPATASAVVSVSYGCAFIVCGYTVNGVAGNDSINVQVNPNDSDGVRFLAQSASATDGPWLTGASSCMQTAMTETSRTIDCTNAAIFVTINANNGNDTASLQTDDLLTFNGGSGDDSASAGAASFGTNMTGGDGNDRLTGTPAVDTLDGGTGADTLTGNAENDKLTGGAGDDAINAGAGNDTIDGGAGRDRITPGVGKDDIKGGDGFDEASYSERTATVQLTIDDAPNDGEAGEEDTIHLDVEDLAGGRGDDVLTGSAAGNFLEGGNGKDQLDGGAGRDALSGGDGDDRLAARDGVQENIDCGGGADTAVGDQIDELFECETADLSADLVADADNDGFTKPGDCNDANAGIRPNAADVPDNGVDENCDGADAVNLDRDGDGVVRPLDCDDSSAAVKPGAEEVPGNTVDEDCSQVADPFPSLSSTVLSSFTAFARFTTVSRLKVTRVPASARVRVTCRGRGCPRKASTRNVRRAVSSLDIRRPFRGRRLRVGARITVTITKPNTIGRQIQFRVRRRALPSSTSRCMFPGKTRAEEC